MSAEPVRILVVGAGAVGCFYASRLHRPPHVLVSLVGRSNYSAIKENGVQLRTHSFGNYTFKPHEVFSDSTSAAASVWDYVVVTTKALPDVSDESVAIVPVVTPGKTSIVLIQNGVGVEKPYRERFGADVSVVSAVTVVSAEQVAPGVVVQNRWTRISLGAYTDGKGGNGQGDADVRRFVELLQLGGIKDAEFYDERGLQMVRWHKIAINASMNPSAVLSNGTGNARMSKDPELRHHLKECMLEVFRGAEAVLGVPLPSHLATPDQILKSSERNTSGRPSMLVDWEKGARMELEVILGNPVRMAREAGVEMARLHSLYALLKMAQERRDEKLKDDKARL